MNLHILFEAIATLSFTIQYNLSNSTFQDFFFFEGNQSQAHLYRKENGIHLYLNHKDMFSSYKFENITSTFSFSWPEFTVNDTKMFVVHEGDLKDFDFTDFTFISPILEMYDDCKFQPLIDQLQQITDVNYKYLILIMVAVVIVIKADVRVIADFIDGIKVKLELENDYISMKSVEIPNSSIIQHNGQKQ